jgi:hypothetical protein
MAQRGRSHPRAAERDSPKNAGKKTVREQIADMVHRAERQGFGSVPGIVA